MLQLTICVISLVLIGIDQLTKWLAVTYLEGSDPFVLISGILSFSYRENTGAAWSILSGQRWLLIAGTSIMLIALIAVLVSGMFKNHKGAIVGGVAVVSGGIGNLIDRIFRGYVVDFIKTDFINFPVFNVADCLIVCGAVWIFIYFVFIYSDSPADKLKQKKGDTSQHDNTSSDSTDGGDAA